MKPEDKQELVDSMYAAYLTDEDDGPYSGIMAACDVAIMEIVELCALEAEKYGANYIAERLRNLKYDK